MRGRHVLGLPLGLAVLAFAEAASSVPTLTGDGFIQMVSKPVPANNYEYLQREKAYSYLDGARDTAEGHIWCDVNQLKTPDLAYELAGQIAKLPAAERKKNASALLLALLGRTYPCPPANGAKP